MPPKRGGRKGKQSTVSKSAAATAASRTLGVASPSASLLGSSRANTATQFVPTKTSKPSKPNRLEAVLTSDKRRGIFECDYCHVDISQVPRIRCAVCPDFDLCLDCFATADHSAPIPRKTSALPKTGTPAPVNHDSSHGYRVCDSTRYPLFPTAHALRDINGDALSTDGMSHDGDEDAKSMDLDNPSTTGNIAPDDDKKEPSKDEKKNSECAKDDSEFVVMQDDPRHTWNIEEDLRLLDAISICGLGNWPDISEAISGQGSSHKTARRCMERYFDDFLGRYGHILPAYSMIEEGDQETNKDASTENEKKRMRLSALPSSSLNSSKRCRRVKVVPTSSLPGYDKIWPQPYIPPIEKAQAGQDVGRDAMYRAEQAFVKLIGNAKSKEEAAKIRAEWEQTRLNEPGGPTVLPLRLEDLPSLPGSELAGFMPRRGDLDVEYQNDAEDIIADMEFSAKDSPQDRALKIQIIQFYNDKLDERERRKKYLLSRGLLDYRKNQVADAKMPRDEKDLVRRMRLFERFHTPEEHKQFIADILKAKRLRKEIAKLHMYRRMGITTLLEAEKYELDKNRREFHKMSQLQKETKTMKANETTTTTTTTQKVSTSDDVVMLEDPDVSSSLWKQYRTNDRAHRRSINRGNPPPQTSPAAMNKSRSKKLGTPHKAQTENKTAEGGETKGEEPKASKPGEKDGTLPAENNSNETTETTPKGPHDKPNFIISKMNDYDLLTSKEAALCADLELKPCLYLKVKRTIIHEALKKDLLDKPNSGKRSVFKIDVKKRGSVIDFMVKSGWIPTKVGKALK